MTFLALTSSPNSPAKRIALRIYRLAKLVSGKTNFVFLIDAGSDSF